MEIVLELLPPSISSAGRLSLLEEILAIGPTSRDRSQLRLKTMEPGFSWQELADLATSQGLLYPLIWSLKRTALLLPLPNRSSRSASEKHPTAVLLAAYDEYLDRRRRQRAQLNDIVKAFNSFDVEPLLLKGSCYLMFETSPWREARDMRDIDLLVRRDDVANAINALEKLGYRSDGEFFPAHHHLPLMWLEGAPCAVEIHTEAFTQATRAILPTEALWQRAIRRSNETGTFFSLPDEWQLLVGVLHHQVSEHGHSRRVMALKGLWEFAALGQELPASAWQAIADHMDSHHEGDVLGSFVAQASRLFALQPPSGFVISRKARAHAESTYRRAFWPYPVRRGLFLADQLRYGFSRETMAVRYGADASASPFRTLLRHLRFLARYYRGNLLRRLTGRGDRVS